MVKESLNKEQITNQKQYSKPVAKLTGKKPRIEINNEKRIKEIHKLYHMKSELRDHMAKVSTLIFGLVQNFQIII